MQYLLLFYILLCFFFLTTIVAKNLRPVYFQVSRQFLYIRIILIFVHKNLLTSTKLRNYHGGCFCKIIVISNFENFYAIIIFLNTTDPFEAPDYLTLEALSSTSINVTIGPISSGQNGVIITYAVFFAEMDMTGIICFAFVYLKRK